MRGYYKVYFKNDMTGAAPDDRGGQYPNIMAVRLLRKSRDGDLWGGGVVGSLNQILTALGFNTGGETGYQWGIYKPDHTAQGVSYDAPTFIKGFYEIVPWGEQ